MRISWMDCKREKEELNEEELLFIYIMMLLLLLFSLSLSVLLLPIKPVFYSKRAGSREPAIYLSSIQKKCMIKNYVCCYH